MLMDGSYVRGSPLVSLNRIPLYSPRPDLYISQAFIDICLLYKLSGSNLLLLYFVFLISLGIHKIFTVMNWAIRISLQRHNKILLVVT